MHIHIVRVSSPSFSFLLLASCWIMHSSTETVTPFPETWQKKRPEVNLQQKSQQQKVIAVLQDPPVPMEIARSTAHRCPLRGCPQPHTHPTSLLHSPEIPQLGARLLCPSSTVFSKEQWLFVLWKCLFPLEYSPSYNNYSLNLTSSVPKVLF